MKDYWKHSIEVLMSESLEEPLKEIVKKYHKDQQYLGQFLKVISRGVFGRFIEGKPRILSGEIF